jgi:AraC family transcriptional regulator
MALHLQNSFSGTRILSARDISGLRLIDGIYLERTKIPNHSHEHAVFCIALKGACRELFAGRDRHYESLTVQFLPPHQCHALDFPYTDTRAFNLDVNYDWLERAREYSLKLEHSIHSHGGLLAGLMMKLYGEFRQADDASRLAIEGLALEILAAASRDQARFKDRQAPRWLERAVELLKETFPERLTVCEIATTVGVHPVHLAREFRRFKRCTVGEYVRELRVARACHQLQNSEESLAAIAAGAGFSDQSHFSRTFKRVIGMTPAAYRSALAEH